MMDWGSYEELLAHDQQRTERQQGDTGVILINMDNYKTFEELYYYMLRWCENKGTVNVLIGIVVHTDFNFVHATLIIKKLLYFMETFKVFKNEHLV